MKSFLRAWRRALGREYLTYNGQVMRDLHYLRDAFRAAAAAHEHSETPEQAEERLNRIFTEARRRGLLADED